MRSSTWWLQLIARQQRCLAPAAAFNDTVELGQQPVCLRRLATGASGFARVPGCGRVAGFGLFNALGRVGVWRRGRRRPQGCGFHDGHQLALQRTVIALRTLAQPPCQGLGHVLDRQADRHQCLQNGTMAPFWRHGRREARRRQDRRLRHAQ
jgi:hypothetical protein